MMTVSPPAQTKTHSFVVTLIHNTLYPVAEQPSTKVSTNMGPTAIADISTGHTTPTHPPIADIVSQLERSQQSHPEIGSMSRISAILTWLKPTPRPFLVDGGVVDKLGLGRKDGLPDGRVLVEIEGGEHLFTDSGVADQEHSIERGGDKGIRTISEGTDGRGTKGLTQVGDVAERIGGGVESTREECSTDFSQACPQAWDSEGPQSPGSTSKALSNMDFVSAKSSPEQTTPDSDGASQPEVETNIVDNSVSEDTHGRTIYRAPVSLGDEAALDSMNPSLGPSHTEAREGSVPKATTMSHVDNIALEPSYDERSPPLNQPGASQSDDGGREAAMPVNKVPSTRKRKAANDNTSADDSLNSPSGVPEHRAVEATMANASISKRQKKWCRPTISSLPSDSSNWPCSELQGADPPSSEVTAKTLPLHKRSKVTFDAPPGEAREVAFFQDAAAQGQLPQMVENQQAHPPLSTSTPSAGSFVPQASQGNSSHVSEQPLRDISSPANDDPMYHNDSNSPRPQLVTRCFCNICMSARHITENHNIASFLDPPKVNSSSTSLICARCGVEGHTFRNCMLLPVPFAIYEPASWGCGEPKEDTTMIDAPASPPLSPVPFVKAEQTPTIHRTFREAYCSVPSPQEQISGNTKISSLVAHSAPRSDFDFNAMKHERTSSTVAPFISAQEIRTPAVSRTVDMTYYNLTEKRLKRRKRTAEKLGVDPETISPTCPVCGRWNYRHNSSCVRHPGPVEETSKKKKKTKGKEKGKKAAPTGQATLSKKKSPPVVWRCGGCQHANGEHVGTCCWFAKKIKQSNQECIDCGVLVGHRLGCKRLEIKAKKRMKNFKLQWTLQRHYFKGAKEEAGIGLRKRVLGQDQPASQVSVPNNVVQHVDAYVTQDLGSQPVQYQQQPPPKKKQMPTATHIPQSQTQKPGSTSSGQPSDAPIGENVLIKTEDVDMEDEWMEGVE